jgi:glycosyltransferase involved in cell wall biosynthesis
MRVLHLAPPSSAPRTITAHTFIDEEILALGSAGIECLTVADTSNRNRECNGVRVVAVPSPAPAGSIGRTLAMTLRRARLLPRGRHALRESRAVFHALRIEQAAASAIEQYNVDLIHSHFGWPAGFGGLLAGAATGVPLVASLRGMDLLHRRDLSYGLRLNAAYDSAVRQLVARADRTIYATDFMRRQGIAAGAPVERAIVIRKGVDLVRFQPPIDRQAIRRELALAGPLMLAVGTLRPLKGYPTLFHALARLSDRAWRLVICGDGPDRDALQALAARLGLDDRIQFAGTVDRERISTYFAAADIFVHASHIEAAGNVVLEALASGCAVVTSDCGGPREHVIEGETGFIVAPDDPAGLAERLRQVLTDSTLCQRLGRAARADVERRFTYPRMVADLIDVYRGTLARTRAA